MWVILLLLLFALGVFVGILLKPNPEYEYVIKKVDNGSSEPMYQIWKGKYKLATYLSEKVCHREIHRDVFKRAKGRITLE